MHKLNEDGKKYIGHWQGGDVIREELKGPYGNGIMEYPNGDRFEGYFHLSYAHINGPAYCARGKYTYANGDILEDCWIDGFDRPVGVYELLHADGSRSIGMWRYGKRWGLEVVLGDTPLCREWEDDQVVRTHTDFIYSYTPDMEKACHMLEVTLADGIRVMQRYLYGDHDPSLHCFVYYPDGDSFDYHGDDVHLLRPWNGYGTYHRAADGKYLWCEWKEGVPQEDNWKYDDAGARKIVIPHTPYGEEVKCECLIWPDGRIKWGYKGIYEGEVKDDRPEGRGVFYDDEGRRYEGEFHEGLAHGIGTYTFPASGIRQEGQWVKGVFQDPEAASDDIMLHIVWRHGEWEAYSDTEWEEQEFTLKAEKGPLKLPVYCCRVAIEKITDHEIVVSQSHETTKILTPGDSIHFSAEIEGREWSDGCVYDGDEYNMRISWPQNESLNT